MEKGGKLPEVGDVVHGYVRKVIQHFSSRCQVVFAIICVQLHCVGAVFSEPCARQ